jgi:hypothetical protein
MNKARFLHLRIQSRKIISNLTLALLAALTLAACDAGSSSGSSTSAIDAPVTGSTKPTPSPSTPLPTPTPSPSAQVEAAPLWEARRSEGRAWTNHTFAILADDGTDLMKGASDMADFCPKYSQLTDNQKVNFWAYLVSAIVKYESDFDPTNRYVETTMGTDPITGQQVVSEGLMQLSYQDVQAYPFCNEFDWEHDRSLSPTDPKKTILDPYKNLSCGLRILNYQVGHYGAIAIDRGQYWAVIKPSSRYNKLSSIQTLTKTLPFCQ